MSNNSGSGETSNPGWFRKGGSGNPRGRPKASRASQESAFDILLEKTFTVTDGDGTREITAEEALQQRTYRDAVAGKRMATREVAKWITKREARLAKHAPTSPWPKITHHISPDPDNADTALVLLGVAAANPARADIGANRAQLLLEPWAVQAALRRRRGGSRLTEKERVEIVRCTREAGSLRWPRETGG